MTYLRHVRGKHYVEYEGPTWSVCLFALTGQRWGPLKATPKYKGTKADMKAKRA